MNETSYCNSSYLNTVEWTKISCIVNLIGLFLIDVFVIAGNTIVIMAVYYTTKLRTVTNLFIVSLAVADLMVGAAVLPFSATYEVYKVWIFGDLLCTSWKAADVWLCTASILNLCAISLDRYIAVTHPIEYPSIMTMRKAKILVASVWILSFVICFPPLVGWKDNVNDSNSLVCDVPQPCRCELTGGRGYVVYSALGSFFIPMFVMLFFYWKIYRTAVQTTEAINQGFRTTKITRDRFDDCRMTLRIHRGRGSSMRQPLNNNSTSTIATNSGYTSIENSPGFRSPDTKLRRCSTRKFEKGHDKIKISVSYPSTDCLDTVISVQNGNAVTEPLTARSGSISSSSPSNSGTLYVANYDSPNNFRGREGNNNNNNNSHLRVGGGRLSDTVPRRCSAGDTVIKTRHLSEQLPTSMRKDLSPAASFDDIGQKPKLITKMGRRNIKKQVQRIKVETKAAKTLGIIVGGFIFCWFPFFTLYLIKEFCRCCIDPALFSVIFWLGYCNSAINPMIYALFSPDFRFAFQRIICSCFSREISLRDSRAGRRASDGSYRRTDRSPSCNDYPLSNMGTNSVQSESEPPSEIR